MARGFTVLVSKRFYYGDAELKSQESGVLSSCTWTVFTTPIVNGEYLTDMTEYHDYPVKPTKKQVRKLTKRAYQVLAEDLLK